MYAAQSTALYKDSPLSGLMLDELLANEALFEKKCLGNKKRE